jgi:hypothetical protein
MEQGDRPVVFERTREQPVAKHLEVGGPGVAEAKLRLDLPQMVRTGVLAITVLGQRRGGHAELEGQVRDSPGRGGRQVVRGEAHESEGDELEGAAQPIVVAAVDLHQLKVGIREGEGAQQIAWGNVGWEAVQTVAIGVR